MKKVKFNEATKLVNYLIEINNYIPTLPKNQKKEEYNSQNKDSIAYLYEDPSDRVEKLDSALKNQMESAFGTDFSDVEIITGPNADQLNREAGSVALTFSNKIYFTSGEYNPSTAEGLALLTHELQHVVQNKRGDRFVYREDFAAAEMEAEIIESAIAGNQRELNGLDNPTSIANPLDTSSFYFPYSTNDSNEIEALKKSKLNLNNSSQLSQKNAEPKIELRTPDGEVIELEKEEYNDLVSQVADAIQQWIEEERLVRSDENYEQLVMNYMKWLKRKI